MATTTRHRLLDDLPGHGKERLMDLAREVSFAAGTRLFREGEKADRFWIVRTGSVILDMHVPGRQAARMETLGPYDLVGWSWLFPPYRWHLGGWAFSPVRAYEFDGTTVRTLCQEDPVVGQELTLRVAEVIGYRLKTARTRLLDLYGPYSGHLIE